MTAKRATRKAVPRKGASIKVASKKAKASKPILAPKSLRPIGRKAGQTYDALVAAACDVIVATGNFSGESVAEKAGMATATFYAYFSTKEHALCAALESVVKDFNARVEPAMSIERLLDDGLRSILHEAVTVMLANFRENAPVYRLGLASLPDSSRMRQIWRYHEHYAEDYIRRFVRLGMAAGRIRKGDPESTATLLLVIFQGLNNHTLLPLDPDGPVVTQFCDLVETFLAPPAQR